jgi:hypothetical protein
MVGRGFDIDENLPDDQAVLAAYRDHFESTASRKRGTCRDPVASFGDHPTVAQHDASRPAQSHPHPGEPLVDAETGSARFRNGRGERFKSP